MSTPAAKAAPPRPKASSTMWTFLSFGVLIVVMFNEPVRNRLGEWAGYVLDPLIGFDDRYPVMTIIISGALLVVGSTLVRHFTTDWIKVARAQAVMRHFSSEQRKAMKANNTYQMKRLADVKGDVMQGQQEMQQKQMKSMPITTLVAIPIYAWVTIFLARLDYTRFSTPWNVDVDMFTTNGIIPRLGSVFPHWVLLYIALSIPLGSLIGKAMKYFAWKERWQKRHEAEAA